MLHNATIPYTPVQQSPTRSIISSKHLIPPCFLPALSLQLHSPVSKCAVNNIPRSVLHAIYCRSPSQVRQAQEMKLSRKCTQLVLSLNFFSPQPSTYFLPYTGFSLFLVQKRWIVLTLFVLFFSLSLFQSFFIFSHIVRIGITTFVWKTFLTQHFFQNSLAGQKKKQHQKVPISISSSIIVSLSPVLMANISFHLSILHVNTYDFCLP